jgi:hypothetical protein
MSTFPSDLDSLLSNSEQIDTHSDEGSYEQQVQAQVEQLGPNPSFTQALFLILKAEQVARNARNHFAHNLRQTVQVVKTHHSGIETIKSRVDTAEVYVSDIKDGQVYL